MPGIKDISQNIVVLLQGCFAGVLLGQMVHLVVYKEPLTFIYISVLSLACGLGVMLAFFKKPIQWYLMNAANFNWIHLASPIIYGAILLLQLLPLLFCFNDNSLIIHTAQVSSLIALVFVVAESYLLQLNLFPAIYASLTRQKRGKPVVRWFLWGISLAVATVCSLFVHQRIGGSPAQMVANTLSMCLGLFALLLWIKFTIIKQLSIPLLYKNDEEGLQGVEDTQHILKSEYFIRRNLQKVILEASPESRPMIYSKIRQIPLVEKLEELGSVQTSYLPQDKELEYTIQFLGRLSAALEEKGAINDIDTISNITEIKAAIRLDIVEGNPMLVQKLLNDNRPEVKKAAILASAFFKEASLIPALVDFLKEHEFAFAAKEALFELGDQCLPFLRSAKYRNKGNSFFIEQCLDLVQSYKGNNARDFLIEMLNEPQKRFRYKAARALLKNNHLLSGLQKTQILHFIETLIGTIALEREVRYTINGFGGVGNAQLLKALEDEEEEKKGLVFDLLKAFVATPVLEVLKKELEERTDDWYNFTVLALIDLFFPLVLRNKCKILLGGSRNENIAPRLQNEYLNEQICFNYSSQEEAVKQVLKMDYGQIGYWLRACALKRMAEMPHQQVSLLILAEVFNNNPFLQEVACEVLYRLNYDYYILQTQRLLPEKAKALKIKIEANQLKHISAADLEDEFLFQQVQRLKSFALLKGFTHESLARHIMMFVPISFSCGKIKLSFDPYSASGYWLVCEGSFTLLRWGEKVLGAREGDVVDMSFLLEEEADSITFDSGSGVKAYFIEYFTFNKMHKKSPFIKNRIVAAGRAPLAKGSIA